MSWLESESRIYKEPSVLSQFWCDKKSRKKTSRYGSCSLFLFLSLRQNQQNLQILTSIPESIEAFTRAIPENISSRLKTICLVQQRFLKNLPGWEDGWYSNRKLELLVECKIWNLGNFSIKLLLLLPQYESGLIDGSFKYTKKHNTNTNPNVKTNTLILRLEICQKIYITQFLGKRILHTENA